MGSSNDEGKRNSCLRSKATSGSSVEDQPSGNVDDDFMDGADSQEGSSISVIIRIVRAELMRSFAFFKATTKMNPYAVVEWHHGDGSCPTVVRTPSDSGSHLTPQWNHTAGNQPWSPGHSDRLVVKVYHERMGGIGVPAFCGAASVDVAELMNGSETPTDTNRFTICCTSDLVLSKDGEPTGVITIQALLARNVEAGMGQVATTTATSTHSVQSFMEPLNSAEVDAMRIDPSHFDGHGKRLGVSGGTAAFFRLHLKPDSSLACGEKSHSHYIGKDLSHARDELHFYQQVVKLKNDTSCGGIEHLIPFMFDCAGVLASQIENPTGTVEKDPVDLLVIGNLFDGCKKLRLLDIKIGQQTASAGWQGKSRLAAFRQALVDSNTNSMHEGFRLEGFDSPPQALVSMDPLLDVSMLGLSDKTRKRALRLMFQRLSAEDIFRHFADTHQDVDEPAGAFEDTMSPSEHIELVLHEMACRLLQLSLACRLTTVPQKWIGSSVALGYDCGTLPARTASEASVRSRVKVSIFDWGRSELNTLEKHLQLSESEQQDRSHFWGYYIEGIDRLLYGSLSGYWNRYGTTKPWKELLVWVYDFDSMSENDFIGKASLSLTIHEEPTTVGLQDESGNVVYGATSTGRMGRTPSTLNYKLTYRECPSGSRLKGRWQLHILEGANLPVMDLVKRSSDPFVIVEAISEDDRRFRQQSSVILGNLNPRWDEVIEIPEVARGGYFEDILNSTATAFSDQLAGHLTAGPFEQLCSDWHSTRAQKETGFRNLSSRLDGAAAAHQRRRPNH
mmetsp:Transcript_27205/g.59123  ORF Transcript_27205/g.59123 Transcript_27205/m.59123 type:complete len:787 (-) Transcript_27205:116-2476(-)